MDKIKEYYDKVEITAVPGGGGDSGGGGGSNDVAPKTTVPPKAPATKAPVTKAPEIAEPIKKEEPSKKATATDKPVKKITGKPKAAATSKKPAAKSGGKDKKKKGDDFAADQQDFTEPEIAEGTVDAKAEEIFGSERLTKMSSSNWKERLEAVEEMTKTVEGLSGDIPAQVLVRTLGKDPGWKDSNFQVLNGKFKMLAIIATKTDFSRRSAWYAIPALVSKIGDIKLKTQAKETLKVFAESISLNYVSLKVGKAAEEAKNPKLQTEALVWMSESVKEFGFRIDLKPHIAFIKTGLAATNPAVRKAAIEFLAVLYIYVGANLRMFFEEEKPALLQQIDAEFEKVKDEKPPVPTRKYKDDGDEEEENAEDNDADGESTGGGGGGGGAMKLEDMVDRIDISGKLTEAVLAKIMDKNWKIRKEGLEEVQAMINEAKFITSDINELPASLKARLSDNNKVLVTMAIGISKQLAESGGPGMVRHKNTMLPGIIGTLSDAKPHLRKAGEDALDSWHSKIGFLPFLDNEILSAALKDTNPNLRATLLGWLEKKLPNEKKLPAELKEIIDTLYLCLEDRNGDVRKAAVAVLPFIMAHVGYDAMNKATGKLDPTSKSTVQGLLDKAKEVMVPISEPGKKAGGKASKSSEAGAAQAAKSAAVAAAAAASAVEVSKEPAPKKVNETKKPNEAKNPKKEAKGDSKKATASNASRSSKAAVVEDDGPAIIHKIGKAERINNEKKLKVLKWNFPTPRDEIITQLKEQMEPCVSPSMHAKLFHADFKFHLQAITILHDACAEYNEAVVESMDLFLKWVTLRFFDTNTSVLLKALEFLTALFTMLERNGKQLSAFEASAFIPYLISRVIGDPKDNVRKSVRDICKLITAVYPASKMFSFLMEGLQSKNVKTRMECLEELGYLISKFGMEVCQPSPKVLKEVAGQIADRDNGVRSAALNCIVEAYNIVGESVFQLVGKLSEKDQSYLDERIKRSGKKESAPPPVKAAQVKAKQPTERPNAGQEPQENPETQKLKAELATLRALTGSKPASAPDIKREFEIDFKSIEGDETVLTGSIPKLKKVDLNDVMEAASIPNDLREAYSTQNKSQSGFNAATTDVAALLDLTIAKISSTDVHIAMESLVQLEDVFKKKKTEAEIMKRIDQYIVTSLVQLKMLFSRHLERKETSSEDLQRVLKLLLSGMLTLFDAQVYASTVSRNVLKDVILYFVTTLNERTLEKFEEPEMSVLIVNRLILRVITNSDKTSCMGACIKLLQELSENVNTSSNLIKLVMKCIWKLTHLLPEFINELKLASVLQDIHNFYKVLPASFWRNRSDRVPQQTVKTVLQTLCKLRGPELLDCLNTIEDKNASEVPAFVMKHCGLNKLDSQQKTENKRTTSPTVSVGAPTNEVLVEIFKKIGSKENSRNGIIELYHFKKKYPDYDVDPFIKNTSPFFQSFIDRSLKTIAIEEKERSSRIGFTNSSSMPMMSNTDSNISSDSAKYLDKLKLLKEKYQKTASLSSMKSETTAEDTKSLEAEESKEPPVPEISTEVNKEKKSYDLDDIKRRLEVIKAAQK